MSEQVQNLQEYDKVPRAELIESLRARDGGDCAYPGCTSELDFSIDDEASPWVVTIDHTMPQSWCKANGWTIGEIWALTNLTLMHKHCNARKRDLIPNEDGSLPERKARTWTSRTVKRLRRPEICTSCNAGRNLDEGQFCGDCGSGPQPARTPKWRQQSPKDCDHDLWFCSNCFLGFVERRSALDTIITGGDGYE